MVEGLKIQRHRNSVQNKNFQCPLWNPEGKDFFFKCSKTPVREMDMGDDNRDIHSLIGNSREAQSLFHLGVHKRFPGRDNALAEY